MILEVDRQGIEAIRKREQALRDALPPHTLDWYTYDNRLALIEEIKAHFHHVPKVETKVTTPPKPEPTSDKPTGLSSGSA